jgi:hypothetical protein
VIRPEALHERRELPYALFAQEHVIVLPMRVASDAASQRRIQTGSSCLLPPV